MAGKKDIVEQALKFIAQHFDEGAVRSAAQPVYKSRERLTYMSPDQFLQLARPIEGGPSQSKLDALRQSLDSGEKIRNMPFLNFTHEGDAARVTGHEGRHRALALKERGVEQMPVIMRSDRIRWSEQTDPGRYDYIQDWPSILRSETGEQSIPFPIERPKEANGGVVREGYQTKGRVVGDVVERALKLVMGGGDDAAEAALRQSAQQATDIPAHLRPGFKVEAAPGADEETRNLVDYLSQRDPSLSFDPQSLAERREDLGTTVPAFHGSPRNIAIPVEADVILYTNLVLN